MKNKTIQYFIFSLGIFSRALATPVKRPGTGALMTSHRDGARVTSNISSYFYFYEKNEFEFSLLAIRKFFRVLRDHYIQVILDSNYKLILQENKVVYGQSCLCFSNQFRSIATTGNTPDETYPVNSFREILK